MKWVIIGASLTAFIAMRNDLIQIATGLANIIGTM